MCGVVGIVRLDGAPVTASELRRMTEVLGHRGPDGQGVWLGERVGFAHTRLSIIDLSGSSQPMAIERDALTFNGEIFNYRELRERLRGLSVEFRTNGDTEVLLRLLMKRGVEALDEIDGQFAFGWYEAAARAVHLVRDPMGVLPLYYYEDREKVVFASEIKAILAVAPECRTVDTASLADYLAQRAVPAPYTLFEGVRKVEPGQHITIRANGKLEKRSYWSVPNVEPDHGLTVADSIDICHDALLHSVQNRLVADVPVGAYLSGGVDSSLIVAMASRLHRGPLNTYSAGFADPRLDERVHARAVSRLFDTVHHEVEIVPADFQGLWSRLTWHRDAPISEPADIAVFRLAQRARNDVKVVLSGEGSDELFGGYPKYRFVELASALSKISTRVVPRLTRQIESRLAGALGRSRVVLRAVSATSFAERQRSWFAPFNESERRALLPNLGHGVHELLSRDLRGDAVQQMLYYDCHSWLSDNLLERGDRMTMAASVESRPPFMSTDLVEKAFRVPTRYKAGLTRTKWLVKQIAQRYLPKSIIDRKKVGFRVPLEAWFRGELRSFVRDLLLSKDAFVCDILERRAVEEVIDAHDMRRENAEIKLWVLMCLEMWHRTFLGQSSARAAI